MPTEIDGGACEVFLTPLGDFAIPPDIVADLGPGFFIPALAFLTS